MIAERNCVETSNLPRAFLFLESVLPTSHSFASADVLRTNSEMDNELVNKLCWFTFDWSRLLFPILGVFGRRRNLSKLQEECDFFSNFSCNISGNAEIYPL